jgi:uncharacterized membrane protein
MFGSMQSGLIKALKSMNYQWIHEAQAHQQTWLFKRNCALSPRQLAACFSVLSLISLGIAMGFYAHGAWFVLIFACIEVCALAAAFFVYARHAADYEQIVFSPTNVKVSSVRGGQIDTVDLEPSWLRVEYTGEKRSSVELVSGKRRVAIGRYVPEHRLFELSRMLRKSAASVKV